MLIRALLIVAFLTHMFVASLLGDDVVKKVSPPAAKLKPTEFLPGPGGIPIRVPKDMQRALIKHRATQSRQLAGQANYYFVIGLLETTHRPRDDFGGGVRGIAALLDVVTLPLIIILSDHPVLRTQPFFLTRKLGPPPPNWYRNDIGSIHKVKGKEAALDLVYTFTIARELDPPDPQFSHRERQWFLLLRTRREEEATAMERSTIESIKAKDPKFRNNADEVAKELKRLRVGVAPARPQVERLRVEIEKLVADSRKLKSDRVTTRLRELNDQLRAALGGDKK